ncbi:MAG: hypothetical protein JO146_02475, partial [Candidatus Eremiobacteraeota bacterium]|nr:hypothetical protein [Candidatus Eremiobacteraeota bacterium]
VVLDAPANLPEEMTALLELLAQATIESAAPAGATVDEALAATGVRAPRDLLEQRYQKEAEQLRFEIERGERKLGNESFVAKAAPNVVAKEREKLEGYRGDLARVEAALAQLKEPA